MSAAASLSVAGKVKHALTAPELLACELHSAGQSASSLPLLTAAGPPKF